MREIILKSLSKEDFKEIVMKEIEEFDKKQARENIILKSGGNKL